MANAVAELVFIPAPGVGHIELAKVLVNRDQRLSISVLLINPPYSILPLTTYIESLAKNTIEHIRFIELPQDQKPPKLDPKAFVTSFYAFINSHCKSVRNTVADMINDQTGSSRVVGFVVDMLCMTWPVFLTANSAFLGFNLYIERLLVDQNQDVIELSYNSEGELVVPCFVNPVPMKVVRMMCQVDEGLDMLVYCFRELRKAKGIMVNTFLDEGDSAWFRKTGHRFVWSLRLPPPPEESFEVHYDDPRLLLPDGFLERTKGIGKVIGWAPQVSLLAHEAVGGFHDWRLTRKWIIEIVTAEEIERGIRRLMEDNEIRAKVKEMSKMSRATVAGGGSSYASVGYLVREIMSNIIRL
ncbi:hypothetical protein L1987_25723 [Smallanthus sonchifolius]|uniref:Uncharacterized protein n=1 Tax=Smallanthus sonchifolius TaxID=185202 RepID=A0ACB9I897_9ASTR|nr:hypothetical protein L1987_25723 [Smallanthus sonchifolius]